MEEGPGRSEKRPTVTMHCVAIVRRPPRLTRTALGEASAIVVHARRRHRPASPQVTAARQADLLVGAHHGACGIYSIHVHGPEVADESEEVHAAPRATGPADECIGASLRTVIVWPHPPRGNRMTPKMGQPAECGGSARQAFQRPGGSRRMPMDDGTCKQRPAWQAALKMRNVGCRQAMQA